MADGAAKVGEEIANSISHGVGLLASIAGLPLLVLAGEGRHDPWQLAAASIFGASLVLLYGASMMHHALPHSRAKRVFRLLDHSAIYILIAGTYTPFALGALRGPWGSGLLIAVWTLALFGIAAKATIGYRFPHLSLALYLGMGWMALVAIRPLVAHVGTGGLEWRLAGGAAYTAGAAFYAYDTRIRYGHFIWHLFVAAGSVCHFVAVLRYAG